MLNVRRFCGLLAVVGTCTAATAAPVVIRVAPTAAPAEVFAAREAQRYLYLATGTLPEVVRAAERGTAATLTIGTHDAAVVRAALTEHGLELPAPEQRGRFTVIVGAAATPRVIILAGDTAADVVSASYEFARLLGVRFALHGDVVPAQCVALGEIEPQIRSPRPLFAVRGIQPFHDFPEGPDWWGVDDYKQIIAQLPKLRMNFIGLHTYPEGGPYAEPTVWIGPPDESNPDGTVTASYPASYFNSQRPGWNWGYGQRDTSNYWFGTAALFPRDAYGGPVMDGFEPLPETPADCNALFERTAGVLREAFAHARQLGVLTCVGTESPLVIPEQVRARLSAAGADPTDAETIQRVYRGTFERAAAAYAPDYYWLWTPEPWTWGNPSEEDVRATLADLAHAYAAWRKAEEPFQLATCGWVLGPPSDRALFDKVLPPGVTVSCINRNVGHSPVERAFMRVDDRPQWAIPWLEDDHAMITPQLWVGRMRRDAVDARKYGCSGLLGIHWRTRVLGPNVAALADAAWDQDSFDSAQSGTGALDGNVAVFGRTPIAGTEADPLYQTVRWGVSLYRVAVPPGAYDVTLHFSETHFAESGQRVFDVKLQGERVLDHFDIIEDAGRNTAVVKTFRDVAAPHGFVDIELNPRVENPLMAALEVSGPGATVKLNCGGPAYADFAADRVGAFRFCPADDFYADWCRAAFGAEVADAAAALFTRLDGNLPRPAGWIGGPGGIAPDERPWAEVRDDYAFVDELAALRPQIAGAADRSRFDYWLASFRYMRAIGQLRCDWHAFNQVFARIKAAETAEQKRAFARADGLPAYRRLVSAAGRVHEHLLATVSTTGGLGNVVNWQQHTLPHVLEHNAQRLVGALGAALPADVAAPRTYVGPPRLIVPTVRTSLEAAEPLRLRALVLSETPPTSVRLHWRPAGATVYRTVDFAHVARGVYTCTLSVDALADVPVLEYHVAVRGAGGSAAGAAAADVLRFPSTAPDRDQTVTRWPGS